MTPQQILAIGIRLFSLWLILGSVKYLVGLPSSMVGSTFPDSVPVSYAIGIGYLIVAALLWFFPMWFAHKIAPRTRFENHINVQGLELARVGCALIGLYFFFHAAADIIWVVFWAFLTTSSGAVFQMLPADSKLNFAVAFFEVVFASILIFRAGDLARLVFRKKGKPAFDE